jgi:hypothetical protein
MASHVDAAEHCGHPCIGKRCMVANTTGDADMPVRSSLNAPISANAALKNAPVTHAPLPKPGDPGDSPDPSPANCAQMRTDLINLRAQLSDWQDRLRHTTGPDGPGTQRAQVQRQVELLQSELNALEATYRSSGCGELPPKPFPSKIFESPVFGSVTLSGAVFSKWVELASEKTVFGQSVQEFLGTPTRPTQFLPRPNREIVVQEFEHGVIINVEGFAAPAVVYGAIYARYHQLGGFDGFLGVPTQDERDATRGRFGAFEGGDIYWDPQSGACHEVHGAIRDRWLALGSESGLLGFPLSDEMPINSNGTEVGRQQMFSGQNGGAAAIYWSATTGAWEVTEPVYQEWMHQQGGPIGKLGFPTTGMKKTTSGTIYASFQTGFVVQPLSGPAMTLTGGLKLQLFRYVVEDDFNVQIDIRASSGEINHGRMPAGGQYPKGSQQFGPDTLLTVAAVTPELTISIWMEAISERLLGEDARMGTITATYDIENLWGLREASHTHANSAFEAEFSVQSTIQPADLGADYRKKAFWPFANFTTFKLSWAQYEKTFRDVAETDKTISFDPFDPKLHLFEILFYETAYNSIAQNGNCFGMCLEAQYARTARSLFTEPIFSSNSYALDGYGTSGASLDAQKPNSSEVADEVNVKHGYQLGAELVNWFLGKWTAGALHDPVRAFRESRDAYRRGDWPVLTVSDESAFSQDHGHVLVPYAWDPATEEQANAQPLSGQTWTILCANPNYPAGTTPSSVDDHVKISVRPFEQTFAFDYGDGNDASHRVMWTGSNTSGGRLLSIPFSELSSQPVTLGDAILSLLTGGVLLILADGQTDQITDEQGRTLFSSADGSNAAGAARARMLNTDPSTRIANLIPIPHRQTGAGSNPAELYYWQRDAAALAGRASRDVSGMQLTHRISGPAGYRFVLRSSAMLLDIRVPGGAEADVVGIRGLGSAAQSISLACGQAKTISVRASGWQAQPSECKWFEFDSPLASGQDLHFQVGNAGRELSLHSPAANASIGLRMVRYAGSPVMASRPQVELPAGQIVRLAPSSWEPDALAASPVNRSVLQSFGGSVLQTQTI